MAEKLLWDLNGARTFETGIEKGVLYPLQVAGNYPFGVAWNGLINITEKPSGAESTPYYADGIKYLNLTGNEEFAGSIEAYTYPAEFAECDGSKAAVTGVEFSGQARKMFGLSYRTRFGNDLLGLDYGYKLHLVYNCIAAPTEKAFATVSEQVEPGTFSWEITTTPIPVAGYRPVSLITIDSTKADAAKLAALEVILYGVAGAPGTAARLPFPSEIITLMTPG